MAIQFNPNVNVHASPAQAAPTKVHSTEDLKQEPFGNKILDSLNKVNQHHQDANASIVDLMTGKQQDINSVVASVAKADMSFKLLVGVRNKLVEAYKETMRMQI